MEALATVAAGPANVLLRPAGLADLTAIVDLIAADQLGASRDGIRDAADRAAYEAAFQAIDADPANLLVVAEAGGRVVGTMQLTFIPGLARRVRRVPRSRRCGSRPRCAATDSALP